MRRVTLFIAMSLDGYIADRDGNVDWLHGEKPGENDMSSYNEFIKGIDTVLMGWNTYQQITTVLSPTNWIYKGLTSYVLTHMGQPPTEFIRFVNEDTGTLIKRLKNEPGRGIWVCGGPSIVTPLVKENLIDRFHISIIPTILGSGIRLFEATDVASQLHFVETKSYNGIIDVIYERR